MSSNPALTNSRRLTAPFFLIFNFETIARPNSLRYNIITIIINIKNMKGYVANIEEATKANSNFRQVLYTGKNCQLVLMSLAPGEEIGEEIHEENDQFFRIDQGTGKVIIDGNEYEIKDGFAVIVPSGAKHNVINTSTSEPLRLYTIYSPPHHRDGVVHSTKEQAEKDDEEFDGKTTE